VDDLEIGQHCGGYSEWWLDVPPASQFAIEMATAAGQRHVLRSIVVAATTSFNYSQCELVRGSEGFFLSGGITRSVEWHNFQQPKPAFHIKRIEVVPLSITHGTISAEIFINATLGSPPPVKVDAMVAFDGGSAKAYEGLVVNTTRDCVVRRNFRASNLTIPLFEYCTTSLRVQLPRLSVPSPRIWSESDPHLHTIAVALSAAASPPTDGVSATFGLRSVAAKGHTLLINDQPAHLVGFNRHEEVMPHGASLPRDAVLRYGAAERYGGKFYSGGTLPAGFAVAGADRSERHLRLVRELLR
jgi:hypothetical protein